MQSKPIEYFQDKMSKKSYELLHKLFYDYVSRLEPELRVYRSDRLAPMIYNLFKGKYDFSVAMYNEILNVLIIDQNQ